jgi:MSHA biogenesis protein MshO
MYRAARQQGFTLVELIVVIVLLGIMSVATVQFIPNMAVGYMDLNRRQGLADTTQLAIERIGREIRNALPGSVRVSSGATYSCLEYVPVLGASIYRSLPQTSASASLTAVPMGGGSLSGWSAGEPLYVAVYPISSNISDEAHTTNPVYDMDTHAIISQLSNAASFVSDQSSATEITVALSAAHRFPTGSPASRFYVVGSPVSYCLLSSTGDLYRYKSYFSSGTQFYASQPVPGSGLPSSEPNRVLLASKISSSAAFTNPAFSYVEATLQRNGLVLFDMQVSEAGESVRIQHAVQVRNAP